MIKGLFGAGCGCGGAPRLGRRAALAGIGAVLAAGAGPARAADDGLVDVHHHLSPPAYVSRMSRRALLPPLLTGWTPEVALADMDGAGVSTAVLSITTPGLWFGDVAETREVARACNEYAAGLVKAHPGRFGSFATLPMPDVDGTLAEIAYALDTLRADGVMMFTSYGTWLGDPALTPVMEELNRRKAVVYTHPTGHQCCVNMMPGVPDTIVEFGTDTSRTIASLLFSGAARRYPDISFIFSHGGGTAPYLMERFRYLASTPGYANKFPDGVRAELARFFYDTAQVYDPVPMAALRTLVPASQVLFGTDFPYRTALEHANGLSQSGASPTDLRAIRRDNARRLMPNIGKSA